MGHLWTIDTTTGAATQGPAVSTQTTGDISWLNGTLYGGSHSGASNKGFYTIDPTTGVATALNSSISIQSLAAIPSLSEFYDVGSTVSRVDIITPTGSIAQHLAGGGNDDFVQDLAYDSLNGVLYSTGALGSLDTIDLSTGIGTYVGQLLGPMGRRNGPIAYDWNTNTLYMLFLDDFNSDNLYSVNTDTGAATLIGPTGLTGVYFTGFADLPVSAAPEPSTAALIAMGVVGFVFCRSRLR